MDHSTVRAAILPSVIGLMMERYQLDEADALDAFYRSATGAAFADDETGLYGQSALYIFGLFAQEMEERRIPFEITADPDPFYSENNVRYLKDKLDALNAGTLPLEKHDLIEED